MGAPEPGMQAAEEQTAESLLTALRTIKPSERAKHAEVLDYWLSIRGDREFPPLHDLDPLQISDAGPSSLLLELIGGGQDAEIRHLGDSLKPEVAVNRIIDAPSPSLLSSIARKLPIVAISREFLAFEDSFEAAGGLTRCWVTMLPLSSCGSWVDYVYAFVSIETAGRKAAKPVAETPPPADEAAPEEPVAEVAETAEETAAEEPVAEAAEVDEAPAEEPEAMAEEAPLPVDETDDPMELVEAIESQPEPEAALEPEPAPEPEPEAELESLAEEPPAKSGPGFSKLLEGFANLTGFYGQGVKIEDPVVQIDPPASALPTEEPLAPEPAAAEPEAVEPTVEPKEIVAADEQATDEQATDEQATDEQATDDEPTVEAAPLVEPQPAPEPAPVMEGNLQDKLTEVRARADEAREAQLRATAALYQGLSAAYDFALDAETSPEEYLRLIEAQGLKIQLRAPMAPVARLAFEGVCDAATIRQFEAVLAWALKVELPRGALLERIEQAGGVPELLTEFSKAA